MADENALNTDIAIVGGGMVGISLALLLATKNKSWRIALIDSYPLPSGADCPYQSSFDARSTALSAGSRQIFERHGLWSQLQQHLTPIRQVHVSDRGHFGGSNIDAGEHQLDAVGYVVENAWLGRALSAELGRFDNIDSHAPASVTSARATRNGYQLVLRAGERKLSLDCQLLVLADGADSRLRAQLGIGLEHRDYAQSAIIANLACDRAHRGIAYERFTADGPLALLPMGESDAANTMALVWTRPADNAEPLLSCSDQQFLDSLQQQFGYRQGTFTKVGQRHLYPLSLSLAKEQIRRSLVLMGNAAHFLHPVAGQGFNLALRDCEALSRTLAQGQEQGEALNDLRLLEDYLARQALDQWATIGLSDSFVRWFSSGERSRYVLRNLGLFALDLLPTAKQRLARQTMGM